MKLNLFEDKNIKFLIPQDLNFFQFLIIHKNPSQEEIVSKVNYQKDMVQLPFRISLKKAI